MTHQRKVLGDTIYFWFGANDTSGSGDDGASALADVRLAGAAASAIPTLSPTPALLTHANYPPGAYEIAVIATTGNGFAAGNTYSVFATLAVDSQNPTGFVGSFELAAHVNSSGYDDGAIWVDTQASNTNAVDHIDGTADNPVSTWAAALTLSASLGINRFRIATDSSITLSANSDNYDMVGSNWMLALGGQSVSELSAKGATVTGTGTGTGVVFTDCILSTSLILPSPSLFIRCGLTLDLTLNGIGGTFTFHDCFSAAIGSTIPAIILNSASMRMNVTNYSGDIEVESMAAGDTMFLQGNGSLTINTDCTGGTITIAGAFSVTDNASAAVTLGETTRFETTNVIDANIKQISDDSIPADNLELQYDGTGLTGDTFPATQAQLNNISSGTAATNTVAASVTVTTGSEVNAYTDTAALDGTVHEVNPDGGNTEFYYEFNLGANGVPVAIQWQGYANSPGDSYAIYARNWAGASWEQVGSQSGSAGSTVIPESFDLTTAHVGTGANAGLVRWRVLSTDGTGFNTDRILCSFATVFQSVGYANGSIWVDTNGSNTNTVNYIDGVADNPVSTWAAALTLSGQLNVTRFQIINGSTITLSGNSDNYTLMGENWILDLNGQSIDGIFVSGGEVSGIGTNGSFEPSFDFCHIEDITIPPSHFNSCGFEGVITLSEAGLYFFDNCHSAVAGEETPCLDFGAGLNASEINLRDYSGGIEIENMGAGTGNYKMSIEGDGQLIINANCSATSLVAIRGHFTVTDNASGAVTLSDDARYDITQINDQVLDVLNVDTFAEPISVPAATTTLQSMLHWLYTLSRNKGIQTSSGGSGTKVIRNDGDGGAISAATITDTAGTFTRDKYA